MKIYNNNQHVNINNQVNNVDRGSRSRHDRQVLGPELAFHFVGHKLEILDTW